MTGTKPRKATPAAPLLRLTGLPQPTARRERSEERSRGVERRLEDLLMAEDVFATLPYGVAVASADGAVIATNGVARELLGIPTDATTDGDGTGSTTCCTLLGCGVAGGSLERGCITGFAREAGARLREVRIELGPQSPLDSVWVTAAPMQGGGRVVLHVRPGEHRATGPAAAHEAATHLHVFTFGRTRVETVDGPLGGPWLGQRAGELFKLLLSERNRVMHAEEIAEILWPDAGRRGPGNVRHFVHVLRQRLEPGRQSGEGSSFIVSTGGGYAVNRARMRIDAEEFEQGMMASLAGIATDERTTAAAQLEHVLSLYRGDFLADEPYAEWSFMERDRLRELAGRGLRMLAEIRRREQDLEGSATSVQRLAELEPYDVGVQRQLIALCLERGRRSEAKRRYGSLRQRMMHEFGEDLDFQLADLSRR